MAMLRKRKATAALTGRRVRLFKNGRSQAVRIPREWELPGNEAVIRKDGDRLIVTPAPRTSLLAALRKLGPLPEKDRMPPIGDFPPEATEPVDL
jgi:antitoxin VapB